MDEMILLQEKLKTGDERAFNKIFYRYYAYLCSIALSYVHDKQISEALSEDVLFAIWEKRKELLPIISIKNYLFIAIRNRSLDYLRNNSLHQLEDINKNVLDIPDQTFIEYDSADELENIIERVVDQLPNHYRRVFLLSRYENKRYVTIAEELDISLSSVKFRIHYSLDVIKANLSRYFSV
jgi:RNA polymerase sigma-70 factor, Bacteroides expansion family 1